jgi:hypothetical protein
MTPWPPLLSRLFPLCFHHSYFRSPQRNHHLQLTWNLKSLREPAPRTPISCRIVYPHRTQFSYLLGQLLFYSTPLSLPAATAVRVDLLARSLRVRSRPTSHRVCTIIIVCTVMVAYPYAPSLPLFHIINGIRPKCRRHLFQLIVHIFVRTRTLFLHLLGTLVLCATPKAVVIFCAKISQNTVEAFRGLYIHRGRVKNAGKKKQ